MTATASRIALGVSAHPEPAPSPVEAATAGTRTPPRRDHGGRFAPRPVHPCCEACGWVLAEDLAGRTYCCHERCSAYRKPVGTVPGVQAGLVTVAVLGVRG